MTMKYLFKNHSPRMGMLLACTLFATMCAIGQDTAHAGRLLDRSIAIRLKDPDSSLQLAEEALRIAEDAEAYDQTIRALIAKANTYWVLHNSGREPGGLDSAKETNQRALDLARSMDDRENVAIASCNLGMLHARDNPFLCIDHHMLALESWPDMRPSMRSDVLMDLANSYEQIGREQEAKRLHQEAIAIADSIGDKYRQIIGRLMLGGVYMSMLQCDSSILWYQDFLDRSTSSHSRSWAHLEIARCLAMTGDVAAARSAIDSVRSMRSTNTVNTRLCEELGVEAYILALEGRSDQARELLSRVEQECAQENVPQVNRSIAKKLSAESFALIGDEHAAYEALLEHLTMKDSLTANKRDGLIMNLQEKYRSREKEATIKELTLQNSLNEAKVAQERQRRWWVAGSSFLIILGGGSYFLTDRRRRRERFEREAAQLETQALRSQMNPHFIFNALNSINAYVQQNDQDSASSYLTKFAKVMRAVLENSRHPEVPLAEDLDALRGYMELERMRMQRKFDFDIQVAADIDPEEVMVPPLVVQPFVENAIWHGMRGKDGQGHITLKVERRGGQLVWTIEDDGVGRSAPRPEPTAATPDDAPTKKTSLGTAITRARLDLVQKQHGGKAGFRYVDLPHGTRVEVDMPVVMA